MKLVAAVGVHICVLKLARAERTGQSESGTVSRNETRARDGSDTYGWLLTPGTFVVPPHVSIPPPFRWLAVRSRWNSKVVVREAKSIASRLSRERR